MRVTSGRARDGKLNRRSTQLPSLGLSGARCRGLTVNAGARAREIKTDRGGRERERERYGRRWRWFELARFEYTGEYVCVCTCVVGCRG